MIWSQDKYIAALNYAAKAHGGQKIKGTPYPYVVHVAEVAQEVMAALVNAKENGIRLDADFTIQCALLHDVIEDTEVTYDDIVRDFGCRVADGVLALSKDSRLPKERQIEDCLERIKRQPCEVWMVKLADRIVNLQPPPAYWTTEKRASYRGDAKTILAELGEADAFLAERLRRKIEGY